MTALNPTSDQHRFDQWLDEHARAVRGYLAAMLRDVHRADDLLQEVFRKAWQARESYQETGHARAYLLRIADRLICDSARKPRREVNLDEKSWQRYEPANQPNDPSDRLIHAETRSQLNKALDQLTDQQRRVLLLRYYGQLTFEEIAKMTQCPLNTALSHCRRGLIALKGILSECAP